VQLITPNYRFLELHTGWAKKLHTLVMHGLLRYRGNRAGRVTHRRQDRASVYKHDPDRQPGSSLFRLCTAAGSTDRETSSAIVCAPIGARIDQTARSLALAYSRRSPPTEPSRRYSTRRPYTS